MPYAQNNETNIYWEEHGTGEPLLLIMGLGTTLEGSRRLLPHLSEKYRVIVFDNRAMGSSSDPTAPFSMVDMANDANAVLDAARIESAHVMGTSMGGMIAQELALNYPEKIRSLILAVTTCGGSNGVLGRPEVLFALQQSTGLSAIDAFWSMAPYLYDAATPRSVLEDDLAAKQGKNPKPQNFIAQLQAVITWPGTYSRLPQIKNPTLILHGANDQLIVPENGKILADKIPNAQFVELENAGHMFAADQTQKSVETILAFLENTK